MREHLPELNTPTRFQDPRRPPTPEMARYAKKFMKGLDLPTESEISVFGDSFSHGDPLADAWIEFAESNLGREERKALINRAISAGIASIPNAPLPLQNLFHALEVRPTWLSDDLLSLARDTVRRSGPLGNWLLVNVALMGGYRYEGVIQPLVMTGRLTTYAPKRLADTTLFVQDVLSQDGLLPGKKGYEAAIRVRLLHAHIRHHLRDHQDWSNERWGAPICQADMLATLLLFSLSYLVTSEALGLKFNSTEAESVIHLWRYVGLLLGVDEHLIPKTETDARRAFYLVGMSQSIAGSEAETLGRALHEVPLHIASSPMEKMIAKLSMIIRAGVSELFLGKEALQHLGVPTTPTKYAVMAAVPGIYIFERIRSRIPILNRAVTSLGGSFQDRQTANLVKGAARLYTA